MALSDTSIRKAVINDSSAIAWVLRGAFIEYEPLYTPAAFLATTLHSDLIRGRWSEGPVWIAEQHGNIVGTVAAVPKTSGLYIRSMAVLPHARGQGIARRLLNEIENFAATHHHQRLFLSTTPFLHEAIRLYERFGFQRTDEAPHDLSGTPLFTMAKLLDEEEAA
jgi:putative acetyltransferase